MLVQISTKNRATQGNKRKMQGKMKDYISFINSKNLAKNRFFLSLNCSLEEGQILRWMAKILLENQNNFLVAHIIESVFGAKGADAMRHINHIKSLLHLEFIYLTNDAGGEILLLELLNNYVALSPRFLKMLEVGKSDFKLPKATAYSDDLAYLQDEFIKIDMLKKMAFLRRIKKGKSPAYSEATTHLNALNLCIKKRLDLTQKTHKTLNILDFIRANNLNENEKTIFFALLKEEYYTENEKIREMDALLELISDDELGKISNKYIFDETSTLLQNGLIDYDDFLSSFKKSFFVPPSVLSAITKPQKLKAMPISFALKNQEIFELIKQKVDLKNIILPPQTRERLEIIISQLDAKVLRRLKGWGIKDRARGIDAKIMLYGHSGTGKTITAYALGNALKRPILSLDCSKILSMYVGESEKNVRKIFDTFENITRELHKDAILLLDEADQFLGKRGEAGSSADKMYNQMQNIFLEQIERFDGILIATTNLLDNIDAAFSRRFNYKIEFAKPDFEARVKIWEQLLPKGLDSANRVKNAESRVDSATRTKKMVDSAKSRARNFAKYAPNFCVENLAKFPLTGGQIKIIIKNTAYKVATQANPIFSENDFVAEIKKEMDSNFGNEKTLGFLS